MGAPLGAPHPSQKSSAVRALEEALRLFLGPSSAGSFVRGPLRGPLTKGPLKVIILLGLGFFLVL